MGVLINEKLALTRGEVEAELAKVNKQITANANYVKKLGDQKAALEALIAEFDHDFPTVVAVAPKTGIKTP